MDRRTGQDRPDVIDGSAQLDVAVGARRQASQVRLPGPGAVDPQTPAGPGGGVEGADEVIDLLSLRQAPDEDDGAGGRRIGGVPRIGARIDHGDRVRAPGAQLLRALGGQGGHGGRDGRGPPHQSALSLGEGGHIGVDLGDEASGTDAGLIEQPHRFQAGADDEGPLLPTARQAAQAGHRPGPPAQGDDMAQRLEERLGTGETGHLGGQAAAGHDVDDVVTLAQVGIAGAEAPDVDGKAARPHLGGEQIGGADDAVGTMHVVHEEDDPLQRWALGGIACARGAIGVLGNHGPNISRAVPDGRRPSSPSPRSVRFRTEIGSVPARDRFSSGSRSVRRRLLRLLRSGMSERLAKATPGAREYRSPRGLLPLPGPSDKRRFHP